MPQSANVIVKGFQGPIEQLKLPEKSTKPIQLIHILTNTGCFATVCGSAVRVQLCPACVKKLQGPCSEIHTGSLSLSLPPSPYTRARTWGLPRSPLKFIWFHFEVGAWLSLYHSTVLPVLSESPTSRSSRTCFGPCVDRKWRRGSDRPTTCGSTLQSPTKG